ncbi:MAG: HDIG domain-containing protein, partial [Muribaculaceae bacterium]|nr:HDIG domain-containing protein [Muribaculaceae bacterium]
MDYQVIIDRYYPMGTRCREIFMRHAEQVATLAVELARRCHTGLDENQVRAAAMLHDIGIFLTDAPGIDCHGKEPYIAHGILGAELLRKEGVDEAIARVAERHTGAGINENDIDELGLPLPRCHLMPETMLEKVVCYADKFYSKRGDM